MKSAQMDFYQLVANVSEILTFQLQKTSVSWIYKAVNCMINQDLTQQSHSVQIV